MKEAVISTEQRYNGHKNGKTTTPIEGLSSEILLKKEGNKPFNFEFYVTDHSPDFPYSGNPDRLRKLYADIKKDGIDSVRYDLRWRNIEPDQGMVKKEQIDRYATAVSIMKEVGLKEPTIVLSSIPNWAMRLYKKDKNKFFDAYRQYLGYVKKGLQSSEKSKISTFQVLNELNNPSCTPIQKTQDLIRICEITREEFTAYNPNLKLMVSVLASCPPKALSRVWFAENIRTFLPKLENIKEAVDIISIDYYPGGSHRLISEKNKYKNFINRFVIPGKAAYKEMFADMSLFEEVAETVAGWGKDYELGETGFPVKGVYWGNEIRQRYFYDTFFRNFKHLMVDFRERGIKLPERIGLYQAVNERPMNVMEKIKRKTLYPEHNWGMRNDNGEKRSILKGNTHNGKLYDEGSRLGRIINYVRAPMKNTPVIENEFVLFPGTKEKVYEEVI